nr:MAG TPA: Terminase large subunit [Caudoviricetes sp.]
MDDLKLTAEQLQKIKLIKQDFYKFAKMNLYIKDKFANIVPFVPNEPQRALIDYVLLCICEKRPVKVIILKARQMGFSTAVEALCYWWTSTNFNINSVIIGNDEKSSLNLYRMFRRYFDNTNILFKPSVRYNTKSDLTFEKFDENGKQIGLGSAIKIETAKNKSAGRSDTVNFLHASELGAWENGEDLVASLMQTVPDAEVMEKPSMVFLESTAEGRGNYFHKEYVAAVNKKNNYQPLFAPWWILDTYERDATFEDLGQLNDYESFLVELMRKGHETLGHKFTVSEESIPRKLAYYRRKAKDFAATPERLPQEYPSTWEEAFIASGKNVFNPLALQEMEKDATPLEDVNYYKITPLEDRPYEEFELEQIPFEPNETPDDFTYKAPLKIWEKPKPYKEYVIGADVAEGLKGGDFSVATVVDISTMEVVARWRGHCDPDKFGEILGALGTYYNYALIGVEVNNHGLTTVQKLRDTFYTNLYKRDRGYDEEWETPTVNLGWKTDMRTKRLMIDDLIKLVRERVIKDKDIVFINEAFSYVRDERGRMNAEEGSHDDVVMSTAIAYQLFPWGDNDISNLKVVSTAKMHKITNG